MNMQAYQQYKEQSVHTMTQSELLLLVLDELVKRLLRAELSLEQNNFELFDQSVNRSVEIVRYLKKTLNHQYEVSGQLSRMYDFFLYELSRIQASRNGKLIQELKPLAEDLRGTFREAARQVYN
ncbi:flagellar export chaperone FliS [Parasporobacterium paucivorans]|uniref:Flagellar protein FliS n=1 Tax=Parasporobacterium paucivorans DSM 15970 TaxID=1122934 RepID=A0A1M6GEJ2_9FIRM|nr:flagellar export chaperone FliS [Parasporobacterium paucivorans]SHJ08386.1 flagellar protein FliS [Parasporobacterium paucivorans DSM 15970]